MKILIVEDNPFILAIIKAAIKVYDAEVAIEMDQFEAEKVFLKMAPDIVISDLHMQEGDTWKLLKMISDGHQTKVLVVSSDNVYLRKVANELGRSNWYFVNKNDHQWLRHIGEVMKIFFPL